MLDVNQMTVFLGWCTVINIGILSLTSLFLFVFKDFVMKVHEKITGVSSLTLPTLYFSYLANYKLAILMLNITPYIALKMIA
ncbi:DUF6868 family protein [Alteromonadales bacterium alter-6D02]|uniref:DUF6868 family protein n=1 Tax=Psychrobium sp. 1_MG-2023 TaxID=3062624 RepID=UPI000C34A649|nr:hypothetical protein CW748_13295 [Alteromonadales bacterium alter-6D02]